MLRVISRYMIIMAIILFLLMHQGCSTLSNGRGWGQDATVSPGWKKVGSSALGAVSSPGVWLPAIAAVALQYNDLDARISNQASKHNYIFGSQTGAVNAGNWLVGIAGVAYGIIFLATPSGNDSQDWLQNKSQGLAVEGSAIGVTNLTTSALKTSTHRRRPNGTSHASFPSSHASNAAVLTRLSTLNLESIKMSDTTRWAADAGLYTISLGTAWARVEAQRHYPSDVLAGMALGNFMAAFFYNAFMGMDGDIQPEVSIGHGNILIGAHVRF